MDRLPILQSWFLALGCTCEDHQSLATDEVQRFDQLRKALTSPFLVRFTLRSLAPIRCRRRKGAHFVAFFFFGTNRLSRAILVCREESFVQYRALVEAYLLESAPNEKASKYPEHKRFPRFHNFPQNVQNPNVRILRKWGRSMILSTC